MESLKSSVLVTTKVLRDNGKSCLSEKFIAMENGKKNISNFIFNTLKTL